MRNPGVRWHHCAMRSTALSKISSCADRGFWVWRCWWRRRTQSCCFRPTRPGGPVAARAVAVEVRSLTLPSPAAIAQAVEPSGLASPSSAGTPPRPGATQAPRKTPAPRAAGVPAPAQPVAHVASSVALAPTRVPPSTELLFALQRGADSGHARLSWQADGDRYALSAAGHAAVGPGDRTDEPRRLRCRRHRARASGRSQAWARRARRQLPTRAWQGHVLRARAGNCHWKPARKTG